MTEIDKQFQRKFAQGLLADFQKGSFLAARMPRRRASWPRRVLGSLRAVIGRLRSRSTG